MSSSTPIIDYEGSHYKTDFWVNQGREYEDRTERLVLQRLLPQHGGRIIEVGAGFGRLADLYTGYEQIILFDYSRSLLQEAARKWGDDPRFVFVAGNVYQLPFADSIIDTLVMVRVMHHIANVPQALEQLHRVVHSESVSIVEYANKRNLKSVLRWFFGKQSWSPFALEPFEFVELNFDFHPDWMSEKFRDAGFDARHRLAVSHFRLGTLKRLVPVEFLAKLDNYISIPGGWWPLSPSIFVEAGDATLKQQADNRNTGVDLASLFGCPKCRSNSVSVEESVVHCAQCNSTYHKKGRIWDFKEKR